jgi:DNA-damage-inducible protein D
MLTKNKSETGLQLHRPALTLRALVEYSSGSIFTGVGMPENQPLQHAFRFDDEPDNFENHAIDNGIVCWYASDLADMLGYQSPDAFGKAVNKAISACTALNIPVIENFQQVKRVVNGVPIDDYKLSRFACYLTTMNASPSKPKVAAAQAYFATLAESFREYFQQSGGIERVLIRDEITDREKSLSGVAKAAGVVTFAYFHSAGYLGMYNMSLSQLRERRGIPATKTPLDFMGKTELAGNLFRITQTEERIKNNRIKGQASLEVTAKEVGRSVRKSMIDIGGTAPEQLPVEEDIKEVRKGLKTTQKEFKKLDGKPRLRLKP